MSKPSITNCPNTFFRKVHSFNCIFSSLCCFACVQIRHTPLSGGYCGEVPPLPIPNREVKLTCADGTAMQCGRVGSRLLSFFSLDYESSRGFFVFMRILFSHADCFFYADCFFVTQIWLSLRPPIFNSQMTQILLAAFSFLLFYPFTYSSLLNDNCCYLISV